MLASAQLPPTGNEESAVRRPFEGELAAVTLWPEIEKIFGHGYEVRRMEHVIKDVLRPLTSLQSITVGVSHSRKLMATACKSASPKHAVVRIYDTQMFRPFGNPLEGHALTVTRIAFSPDDSLIVTVSRDRTWRLFRLQLEGLGE